MNRQFYYVCNRRIQNTTVRQQDQKTTFPLQQNSTAMCVVLVACMIRSISIYCISIYVFKFLPKQNFIRKTTVFVVIILFSLVPLYYCRSAPAPALLLSPYWFYFRLTTYCMHLTVLLTINNTYIRYMTQIIIQKQSIFL